MEIRTIKPNEYQVVSNLVEKIFSEEKPSSEESELVGKLRDEVTYEEDFELVAIKDQEIIAHGMLSDIAIGESTGFLALAPLGVKKEQRNQGIGSSLLKELEQRASENGYRGISILGDPGFYGRLGYQTAADFNISTTLAVPAEYYLIKEIVPDGLKDISGQVTYVNSFGLNN